MNAQASAIVPFQQKVANVRTLLEKSKGQIQMALPRHISLDRMLRVAMTSIQKTPKLLECNQTSLLAAIMQAAQLGLEPDGLLGQAYLVPFKTTVTLIPGYKGLLKLARNSGEISTVQAHEVYKDDHFKFSYGLEPKLEHEPNADSDMNPDNIVAFYAIAKLKDGGTQFEVMWRKQVDAIRKRSKSSNDGPWVTDYAEMGKKTVLRRLCKMLPSSIELAKAVALDEQAEAGIKQDLDTIIDISATTEEEPKSALDALVDADKGKEPNA